MWFLFFTRCASIIAIETGSRSKIRQWLSYWILHSMITLFELSFAKVLSWIFIWPYMKLILICWLVIPNFSILMGYLIFLLNFLMWYLGSLTLWLVYGFFGISAYAYEQFVRPFFVKHRLVGVWHVPEKGFFSCKLEDILDAWKFISEGKWKEA
ncbi:hva22-like protein a [Quercus suber]|uniref:HVA22-like protein n=1 Tax=Quercus suber TaxID=58331 RepID=A0AAW0JBR2_QUESU